MLGDYLKRIMSDAGSNPYQLSRKTASIDIDEKDFAKKGVSTAYIRQLLTGAVDQPSPKKIKLLAKALGVSYMQMMSEAGYIEDADLEMLRRAGPNSEAKLVEKESIPIVKMRKIPIYDMAVCAGDGGMFEENQASEMIAWSDDADFVITVSGDSMEPRLPNGVQAGIKKCRVVVPKKMMLVSYRDEFGNGHNAIKYVSEKDGLVTLTSENNGYVTTLPAKVVNIIGYVVNFVGKG